MTDSEAPNPLDEIFDNASNAFQLAEKLNDEGQENYALHLSIVSCEECSKYLLVYCKDHLPDEYFQSRFRHVPKYAFASTLYYLTGGLSVIYQIKELHDSDVFIDGKKGLAEVVRLTLKSIGWGNPEELAKRLLKFVSAEKTEEEKIALKKAYKNTEKLRTQSLYVDVNDDLSLVSTPSQIENESVVSWLNHARVGIAILTFLRASEPDLKTLFESVPADMREEVMSQADDLIAKMKGAGKDQS